jgi:hypothetical protein
MCSGPAFLERRVVLVDGTRGPPESEGAVPFHHRDEPLITVTVDAECLGKDVVHGVMPAISSHTIGRNLS